MRGYSEIVRILLDNGANVDGSSVYGFVCIFVICSSVEKFKSFHVSSDSSIFIASKSGLSEIVDLLLFRNANIFLPSQCGYVRKERKKEKRRILFVFVDGHH